MSIVDDSTLETTFDYYFRILLPDAEPPISQHQPLADRRWALDRAWPEIKLGIELDGGRGGGYGRQIRCQNCGSVVRAFRKDGSPGKELRIAYPSHDSADNSVRDAEKANKLQLAGWMVLRFTSIMLEKDPDAVMKLVQDAILYCQGKTEVENGTTE